MTRPSTLLLVDKALRGRLKALLKKRRAEGASYDRIAVELHDRGIDVSGETIRLWCHKLGVNGRTRSR